MTLENSLDVRCATTALQRAERHFEQGNERFAKELTHGALELIAGVEHWGPME